MRDDPLLLIFWRAADSLARLRSKSRITRTLMVVAGLVLGVCVFERCILSASGLQAEQMEKVLAKTTLDPKIWERLKNPKTLILYGNDRWLRANTLMIKAIQDSRHEVVIRHLHPAVDVPPIFERGKPLYHNVVLASVDDWEGAGAINATASGLKPKPFTKRQYESLRDQLLRLVEHHKGGLMILGYSHGARLLDGLLLALGMKLQVPASSTDEDIGNVATTSQTFIAHVQDHFHNVQNNPSVVLGVEGHGTEIIFESLRSSAPMPIYFKGPAHLLPPSNALVFPLLTAAPTAFLDVPPSSPVHNASGADIILVSALQTRTNGRLVISGASSVCDDTLIFEPGSANYPFCVDVFEWVAQERGVVEWTSLQHRKAGELRSQEQYRQGSALEVQLDVVQLKQSEPSVHRKGKIRAPRQFRWVPLLSSHPTPSTLQFEFRLLDPYWRLGLQRALKPKKQTTGQQQHPDEHPDAAQHCLCRRATDESTKLLATVRREPLPETENPFYVPEDFLGDDSFGPLEPLDSAVRRAKDSYIVSDGEATVGVRFTAPDKCGVFKSVISLTDKGLSFLLVESLTPIRQFRHDEYDRFHWHASPYIVGSFVSSVSVILFAILFIHTSPDSVGAQSHKIQTSQSLVSSDNAGSD